MDLASVIGYLMCFVLIIISIMLSAGPTGIKSFIDAPSMLITIGGSFMVVFASNTVESFIAGLKILPVYMKAPASDTASIIKQIVELSNAARKEGLLALEGTAREMEDKFMQKGLLLVVDGTEPEMVKSVMEAEIDTIDARHKERIQVFEDLGHDRNTDRSDPDVEEHVGSLLHRAVYGGGADYHDVRIHVGKLDLLPGFDQDEKAQ